VFRDRIQSRYGTLSPRLRALADFVLENTVDAAQQLGYSGNRELSHEIKSYIRMQHALRCGKEKLVVRG